MKNKRIWLYSLNALVLGFVIAFILSELLLRILHPNIASKDINQLKIGFYGEKNQVNIQNLKGTGLSNPKLDSVIYKSTNNISFRGPDLPVNNKSLYKIIAVGGSTTICDYLSDGEDWPNIIGTELHKKDSTIWINNAGIDGHSTFGHIQVLPEIILPKKPQMILFLIGCNDVFRNSGGEFDKNRMGLLQNETHTFTLIYKHIFTYRFISNLYFYFRNKWSSKRFKVYHQNIDFKKAAGSRTNYTLKTEKLETLKSNFIPGYKERIATLIKLCKNANVVPVFITQPTVLGNTIDSTTGVNLAEVGIDDCNGDTYWSMLELYNQALKSICLQNNCHVIDLADSMPKNTVYYYDYFHFTKQGSKMVADIILQQLPKIIQKERKDI